MMFLPILFIVFSLLGKFVDCQISAMFGNPIQADNCQEWSEWNPCIWLHSQNRTNKRFDRSYFDQLLPGRKGCRSHVFFKILRERFGTAFDNFYNYLRKMTISEKQCGECSYQQSCGRNCHRRGSGNIINPLFVAERKCADIDQSDACVSRQLNGGCNLWPNPAIPLPNVTSSMVDIINGLDYLTCIPEKRINGDVCRCCCHPYSVNPNTFKCELKSYLRG
uniref:Uncharacterized protein n=1 Tax=Strongyloides venezuelensis TaxID=75913 RepID=A0A0K0F5Z6_STRVS